MSDTDVLDYETKPSTDISHEGAEQIEEKKVIDHHGLQTSSSLDPQEEVVYDQHEESLFHVTRALFIGNLRKPINAIDFQNHLKSMASEVGAVVERAWLNRSRTHGIVLLNNDEGSQYIRNKLNGQIYPSEDEDSRLRETFEEKEAERYEAEKASYEEAKEGKSEEEISELKEPVPPKEYSVERIPLYIDYMPVKAINQWIFEEDRGPRDGTWKVIYESNGEEIIANHSLLTGSFMPRYNLRSRGRGGRGRGAPRGNFSYNRRGNYGYDNGPRPYGYMPRNNYESSYRRGGQGYKSRPYHPYRSERDHYSSGNSYSRDAYDSRGRSDSYNADSYARSRSRSPL